MAAVGNIEIGMYLYIDKRVFCYCKSRVVWVLDVWLRQGHVVTAAEAAGINIYTHLGSSRRLL